MVAPYYYLLLSNEARTHQVDELCMRPVKIQLQKGTRAIYVYAHPCSCHHSNIPKQYNHGQQTETTFVNSIIKSNEGRFHRPIRVEHFLPHTWNNQTIRKWRRDLAYVLTAGSLPNFSLCNNVQYMQGKKSILDVEKQSLSLVLIQWIYCVLKSDKIFILHENTHRNITYYTQYNIQLFPEYSRLL